LVSKSVWALWRTGKHISSAVNLPNYEGNRKIPKRQTETNILKTAQSRKRKYCETIANDNFRQEAQIQNV
jgi:hypothetical protein